MAYFVYILYSKKADRYYIGQTENVEERLSSHLAGISGYTSIADDWQLKYHEEFPTRTEAIRREREMKKKKSRSYIEFLIRKESGN